MPLHDWTRVEDGIFHDFHGAWIVSIRRALNHGILPRGYYALGQQVAGDTGPDVATLQRIDPPLAPAGGEGGGAALLTAPESRTVARAERESFTRRQRSIAIRHISHHRVVATIEIVSAANKSATAPLQAFVDKILGKLSHRVHVSVIDLHPPTRRDPSGIHGAIWEALTGEEYTAPPGEDRTLVAYAAGMTTTAYVEPVAVGRPLPEIALFLEPDGCVMVPLETTYAEAFDGVPEYYQEMLNA